MLAASRPRLRPYQVESINAIKARYREGDRSTMLVLATGCGKTVVFSDVARRVVEMGGRVLVLAHRGELLAQARDKLAAFGIFAEIEQAERYAMSARVVVASVQTLRESRLHRFPRDYFDLIIIDEAHHAAAVSYGRIVTHFSEALLLGVTATPFRADGKTLKFDSTAYHYGMRQAMGDGFLAPVRSRIVTMADLDLARVHLHKGDFDQLELGKLMRQESVAGAMAEHIVRETGTRKTMVFTVDVASAKRLAWTINRCLRRKLAVAIDGQAEPYTRARILEKFKRGGTQYLINCALFTEGFDEPSVQAIVIARPTRSLGLHTQMTGRGTRLHRGKPDVLVLDFEGNTPHRIMFAPDAVAARVLEPDELLHVRASGNYVHEALDRLGQSCQHREHESARPEENEADQESAA